MFIPYLARDDADTFDLLQSGNLSEYESEWTRLFVSDDEPYML